jgi:hypothetical protein
VIFPHFSAAFLQCFSRGLFNDGSMLRPSVLVEALAMLLASEVVESNGSATAEWKAKRRWNEKRQMDGMCKTYSTRLG